MAKPGERKVGRVQRYKRANGRTVPVLITALNGASNVDLTVLSSRETFTNVAEMTNRANTAVWLPGSRWRYPA